MNALHAPWVQAALPGVCAVCVLRGSRTTLVDRSGAGWLLSDVYGGGTEGTGDEHHPTGLLHAVVPARRLSEGAVDPRKARKSEPC